MKEDNLAKLNQIFDTIFELDGSINLEKLNQANHKKWDSLAQVLLISAIESEFHISIEVSEYEKFMCENNKKKIIRNFLYI